MTDPITGYYNRFNPADEYEEHLFRAGFVLQSAELNEIQSYPKSRMRAMADAIFKDGDIIRDARAITIDPVAGLVRLESGAVYIDGAVRGVPEATLTIPPLGVVNVGIFLRRSVVTEFEDPNLRDPATGVRNFREAGAARARVETRWGYAGDAQVGEFYPVHVFEDGTPRAKEQPPQLDSFNQALARYDRDSAGGNYVISGLTAQYVGTTADDLQTYSVEEGRARVDGFPIEYKTATRVVYDAKPDLKLIDSEPHASATAGLQRIDVDRAPYAEVLQVRITAEKTVTLTHGTFLGANDLLPDSAVLQILEVKQGAATFVLGTDFRLSGGGVDWSLSGAEVATGSTYTVKYRHIISVTPTNADPKGFSITGAVVGTLILVTYKAKMPRIDRLCLDAVGRFVWVRGVSSFFGVRAPNVSGPVLAIATVYQTWDETTFRVENDGTRLVAMQDLQVINNRLDFLTQQIATQRLVSDVNLRDASVKKGIFVDPFLSDSMRDQGLPQTASIVNGELVLPITETVTFVPNDVTGPTFCPVSFRVAISNDFRTAFTKVNPYTSATPLPASVVLTPTVDNWVETVSQFTSPTTVRINQVIQSSFNGTQETTRQYDQLVGQSSSSLEKLRQIDVRFNIEGFDANETVLRVEFDGIAVEATPI